MSAEVIEAVSGRVPESVPEPARRAILAWYADRGRPLAFRRTTDPYAILVSEVMAQQTQAARAAAYWERFLARFPTVEDLAAATPADVLREWQGLGYDRRALALWRAAGEIVRDHGGTVPDDVATLESLPGIGPYTARAVAALAYGRPVGAVDVNVRRVLGRIVAGGPAALPARELQAVADASVPQDSPGVWTHALMDLGATVCRLRQPRCEVCPARRWCRALATGAVVGEDGPRPGPRPRAKEPAIPFRDTDRWLRGRILDRLRLAPDGAWVSLDGPIGTHSRERVRVVSQAMASDGVIELERTAAEGDPRARLPLA